MKDNKEKTKFEFDPKKVPAIEALYGPRPQDLQEELRLTRKAFVEYIVSQSKLSIGEAYAYIDRLVATTDDQE